MASRELAKAGHIVYAGMRETKGRNALQAEEAAKFARQEEVDLRVIEMDVVSDESVESAIKRIIEEHGRLDVIVLGGFCCTGAGRCRSGRSSECYLPGLLISLTASAHSVSISIPCKTGPKLLMVLPIA